MIEENLQIVKLILSCSLYEQFKPLLIDSMFPDPVNLIWQAIQYSHDKYKRDVTEHEVYALVTSANPTMTQARKDSVKSLLDMIAALPAIGGDIAEEVIRFAWRQECAREMVERSYELLDSRSDFNPDRLQELLDQARGNYIPQQEYKYTPVDLDSLLESIDTGKKWNFNIPSLHRVIPGLPSGTLTTIFGRPESSKTLSAVHLIAAPDGFLQQGAKVAYLANEEYSKRTLLRMVSAWTGKTSEDIRLDLVEAKAEFSKISSKLMVLDINEWSYQNIDEFCKETKPDVVFVDQLDKVQILNKDLEGHERLRKLYTETREISKKHDCCVFAISQCSAEGEGKSVLDFSMLEGSRTGKASECDVIIGIGSNGIMEKADGMTNMRTLNICKNKISGMHPSLNVYIQPTISRIRE